MRGDASRLHPAACPSGPWPQPQQGCPLALPCLQIRLDTLLRLHAIKWLCFFFLEADRLMRAPGHRQGPPAVASLGVLFGQASAGSAACPVCSETVLRLHGVRTKQQGHAEGLRLKHA